MSVASCGKRGLLKVIEEAMSVAFDAGYKAAYHRIKHPGTSWLFCKDEHCVVADEARKAHQARDRARTELREIILGVDPAEETA